MDYEQIKGGLYREARCRGNRSSLNMRTSMTGDHETKRIVTGKWKYIKKNHLGRLFRVPQSGARESRRVVKGIKACEVPDGSDWVTSRGAGAICTNAAKSSTLHIVSRAEAWTR